MTTGASTFQKQKLLAPLVAASVAAIGLVLWVVAVGASGTEATTGDRGDVHIDASADDGSIDPRVQADMDELARMQSALEQNPIVLEASAAGARSDDAYSLDVGITSHRGELESYCIEITNGGGGCEGSPSDQFDLVLWDGEPNPFLAWQVPAGFEAIKVDWEGGDSTIVPVKRPLGKGQLGFAGTAMPEAGVDFTYAGVDAHGEAVTQTFDRPPVH